MPTKRTINVKGSVRLYMHNQRLSKNSPDMLQTLKCAQGDHTKTWFVDNYNFMMPLGSCLTTSA